MLNKFWRTVSKITAYILVSAILASVAFLGAMLLASIIILIVG